MDVLGDKWTLLVLRDLASGPRRFVDIRSVLPGISTEQLRARLTQMTMAGLLTRERFREAPPRVEFTLTERGRAALSIVHAYTDWGREYVWGPPRETEAIDVGAVFRAAVGVPLRLAGKSEVAVVVERDDAGPLAMRVSTRKGRLWLEEGADGTEPSATISGSEDAWIDALRPQGDTARLTIAGDEALARQVLGAVGAEDPAEQPRHAPSDRPRHARSRVSTHAK